MNLPDEQVLCHQTASQECVGDRSYAQVVRDGPRASTARAKLVNDTCSFNGRNNSIPNGYAASSVKSVRFDVPLTKATRAVETRVC